MQELEPKMQRGLIREGEGSICGILRYDFVLEDYKQESDLEAN
jgi:hypothetical protein